MKQTTTTVTTTTTTRNRIDVAKPRLKLVKRVRTIVVRTRIPVAPRVKQAAVISVTTTRALPAPRPVNELTVRERRRLPAPR
jgi:hypothetical protein